MHPELASLTIAHLDCDAFYAAIEKRDDPALADRPVIIGGGRRGVVSTACYVARTYGVRSAMPMFQALKLCPKAVVISPNMPKYAEVSRTIRRMCLDLTPLVEPLSIDEAFLDLAGTTRVHGAPPAIVLSRLQTTIEREVGVTVSIGLSHNKFLAKIASELDKPNGFSAIGSAEARSFLAPLPVTAIWGVGAVTASRLAKDGYPDIGALQREDPAKLARRYGELGLRLACLARGDDRRPVTPHRPVKSVSAETTLTEDSADIGSLTPLLRDLCERVSRRMKQSGLVSRHVALKLKDSEFRTVTRSATIAVHSNLARTLFDAAEPLLRVAVPGRTWRLIGVGYADPVSDDSVRQSDLLAAETEQRSAAQERALDQIREKYGDAAIGPGRSWRISGAANASRVDDPHAPTHRSAKRQRNS